MERIAIIGLGYVGLPLALALARQFDTVGFDLSHKRVAELTEGIDRTREVDDRDLKASSIRYTTDPSTLGDRTFFIVTVPTPVDAAHQPDLSAVKSATRTVGSALTPGAIVVYESTVYPGVTEEICRTILAEVSGLRAGSDFKVGYSPERINPGDKERRLERITKVVSGEDASSLARIRDVYGSIIEAGVHCASSIKVAEAAKVIENTQRDLNIALMNELALIFDRLGISTRDVLAAARTKWNFLPFYPGLVGGHCIGVDPYYLTAKAESVGYHPQVILAGRRVNDGMGAYVAQRVVKAMIHQRSPIRGARVAIFGLTFKENVTDIRNSRVPDIVNELRQFGVDPLVHDPLADAEDTEMEYGIRLSSLESMRDLDAAIIAVAHSTYLEWGAHRFAEMIKPDAVLFDVKGILDRKEVPQTAFYESL